MEATLPILFKVWKHITPKRQKQFYFLMILIILSSFTEILSISAVIPFLVALMSPEKFYKMEFIQTITNFFNIYPEQLLLPLTVIFCFVVLCAAVIRLVLLKTSTVVAFAAGADLSADIYRKTLYQPYSSHLARNSSEIISGITIKTNAVIYSAIVPTITLITSTFLFLSILGVLLYMDPTISLTMFFCFGLIYGFMIYFTGAKKIQNSQKISQESNNAIKTLQEGLGGIRDVLIDGTQDIYCSLYKKADWRLRQAQGNNLFVSQSPRFVVEAVGIILIVVLAFFLSNQPNGLESALPILGAMALGMQRLLPAIQQAYSSWSSVQGGHELLKDTLYLLDQPLPSYLEISSSFQVDFQENIKLENIWFRYDESMPWVLRDLNLNIPKGVKMGFIGETGAGKSTLLDIIMGLLSPTKGIVNVDSITITQNYLNTWRNHIAHVPQVIYLADTSIEENIAFGIPKELIDRKRVKEAAIRAQIEEVIQNLPKGYETIVGERGVRLSGGQRQRIGIARALYKKAKIIILDEATSALDSKTEEAVMQAITECDEQYTLLVIAHRISTLKNCSKIIKLHNGSVTSVCEYDDLINNKT
jgi:ABC-type multidrug transport system fused ATPase/permease subunit